MQEARDGGNWPHARQMLVRLTASNSHKRAHIPLAYSLDHHFAIAGFKMVG